MTLAHNWPKTQVCVSVFLFSDHCIKQIDSMLPWVCSVIDHRWRQNVVKTTVTHSPAARVPLLCFYDILTSSVIYYWTDARQHGIYLWNRQHHCNYWLAVTAFVFRALLKARNGLCKRLLSKPTALTKTHLGQRIQRQVFWWRGKISFMVRVVEADGATVSESRGATLWLLHSLARQYWMLNKVRGMGIGEKEMEGTIPAVPRKIFWQRQ